jgi:hypothetical protein
MDTNIPYVSYAPRHPECLLAPVTMTMTCCHDHAQHKSLRLVSTAGYTYVGVVEYTYVKESLTCNANLHILEQLYAKRSYAPGTNYLHCRDVCAIKNRVSYHPRSSYQSCMKRCTQQEQAARKQEQAAPAALAMPCQCNAYSFAKTNTTPTLVHLQHPAGAIPVTYMYTSREHVPAGCNEKCAFCKLGCTRYALRPTIMRACFNYCDTHVK